MTAQVKLSNGRVETVWNAGDMTDAAIAAAAIARLPYQGTKHYVWSEAERCASWQDCAAPTAIEVKRMREVYQGGGYCLVDA